MKLSLLSGAQLEDHKEQGKGLSAMVTLTSPRGSDEMAKYKIEIVRPECSGCELCTTTCPDLFEMADDGLSTIKGGSRIGDNDELDSDDAECAKEAAESCPSTCIHVYEGGNKLV